MIFKRKFDLKTTQQLILDGWQVYGDRRSAYRNGEIITPATYQRRQVKRSGQQK